ncbi:eye pigment precursor family transporter white isoform X2 [Tachypleus tridentatus]|uniref:eye pigment precursor family transporter white isoform X2 n=1 Tax=Tachypleus tridentatus TaxID=6853 RepID=UPI003FD3555E
MQQEDKQFLLKPEEDKSRNCEDIDQEHQSNDNDHPSCGDEGTIDQLSTEGYDLYRPKGVLERTQSRLDGVSLSWQNLDVFVPEKKEWSWRNYFRSLSPSSQTKQILQNVSGEVKPGQLLAILGASGAGKTTLLNVLTGRNLGNFIVQGSVRLNRQPVGRSIAHLSAYVQQEDLFIGTLTVKEHLMFNAMLRMDKRVTKEARERRINEVLIELGLKKCENTTIGLPSRIKGISGGEKKRLAFASEILTNPSLMFCDEPTSGLDSFMAQSVISVVKDLATSGRTIICTIHQPSSEVYAMFDQILLMAEGRVAYMGSAVSAFSFFESIGKQCPRNFNPADFFIHTLAVTPGREEECRREIHSICDEFIRSEFCTLVQKTQHGIEKDVISMEDDHYADHSIYKASWFTQVRAVGWRSFLSFSREPLLTTIRFAQTIFMAVLLGAIYWNQDLTQESVQNINGVLFLLLTNMTFQNMFGVINVFCEELPVFLREHWNGMYRTDVYFRCKTFTEFCFVILGLYDNVKTFLICNGIVILISNTATSFGYLMSCISSTVEIALSIGPVLLIPLMMFGGFFLNNASTPVYFVWLKYVSWFYYGNEALSINQWRNINHIACNQTNIGCIPNGKAVLMQLNFDEDNFVFDNLLLVTLLVGLRTLAFIGLLIRASRKN